MLTPKRNQWVFWLNNKDQLSIYHIVNSIGFRSYSKLKKKKKLLGLKVVNIYIYIFMVNQKIGLSLVRPSCHPRPRGSFT